MKAVVCVKYGPPEVLKLDEVPSPIPRDNEVLVKVRATTVNRTDYAILKAKPFFMRVITGLFKPKKQTPGTEFAGDIEAVGRDVSMFKVGDKVFGFDDMGSGAQAQYLTIPENQGIATIPANTTYEQATASIEGAHYAYNSIKKAKLKKGQRALVNGATGAIGSAAVQLLKYYGLYVTAVCNTKNMELVKSLGADKAIDYTVNDFTKDKEKYDFVFDAVGKSSFFKCKPLLKPGGVYISSDLGYMAQNMFLPFITPIIKPLIGNNKTIFPFPTDIRGTIYFIKKLIEAGKFKAVIDREYQLEQIVEAYRYVATGQKTGNVVIIVEHYEKT